MQISTIGETSVLSVIPTRMADALRIADVPYERVKEMSLDEISEIKGIGEKTLADFARRAGREEEWKRSRSNSKGFMELDTGQRVLYVDIQKARKRRDVMAAFGVFYDFSLGTQDSIIPVLVDAAKRFDEKVSDEDVARYLVDLAVSQAVSQEQPEDEPPGITPVTLIQRQPVTPQMRLERTVRDIIAKLSEEYDMQDAPANDREQVEHLAEMMARRRLHDDELRRLSVVLLEDGDDGEKTSTRKDYDWEQRQVRELDSQIASVQKDLQITPQGRAALQGTTQAWEVLRELVDTSKDVRTRLVRHHVDGADWLGYTVWYHPAKKHKPHCADCGSDNIVFTGLSGAPRRLFLWTDEAEKLYTQAKNFIPSGAPRGIGVFDDVEK